MSPEQWVYGIVAFLASLTILQGFWMVAQGVRFCRHVQRATAGEGSNPMNAAETMIPDSERYESAIAGNAGRNQDGGPRRQPRVAVIMPCCGVDERLHQTVERLGRQNYPDYEVIFTLESESDPAYQAIGRWTDGWSRLPHQRVVAGLARRCSQKIHNLLAAVERVAPDREVLVFLDSDAVPSADWLTHLVAPLSDDAVGAATGFRWYCAAGGIANGVRSVWNAAILTRMSDEKRNFCWGGATAIRRDRFKSLDIARRWQRALSDDYQVTRAVRDAGLAIRFVPQALIPSHDRTTLRGFWTFARRQLIITRICGAGIWWSSFLLCTNFIIGGTAAALLFFYSLLISGNVTVTAWALAGWMTILGLVFVNVVLRQVSVRRVLGPPDVTWKDAAWDLAGVFFGGTLHQVLFISSMTARQFAWRNTVYEMISPDETRILGRLDPAALS